METINLNGKEVTIRELAQKDLEIAQKHLDYFNAILDEDLYIRANKRVTLEGERAYLAGILAEQARGGYVHLVSECDGKIVSNVESRLMIGKQDHIAVLGVVIAAGFRGIGLGSELMRRLISLTKKEMTPPPLIIQSGIFSANEASLKLHQKFGFKEVARVPGQFRHDGRLVDEVIVQLNL